ncbi:MAG: STAS domain-containing protein [Thioalkalispiraceae bacterium]|jgi:anti-sigma B factor antagonist
MECSTRQDGDFTIITLTGEVDLHYSPQARELILENLKNKNHVLVDLSAVEYIDSSGIASLVEGFQLARSQQLKFGLLGVSNAARQVLELAKLDKVFEIRDQISDFNHS